MNILSDPSHDVRTPGQPSGGYEWWYFDAISTDGRHSFVIIFYEGNPFSGRYIDALEDETHPSPAPSQYPAVSISVYEEGEPVYYSFTEFDEEECHFGESDPSVQAGPHRMERKGDGGLQYLLEMNEQLPSGDWLKAEVTFASDDMTGSLFEEEHAASAAGHDWNLVQPRAEVEGTIAIGVRGEAMQTIAFRGVGYHDHNTGREPMRNEFTDWYWGRFHFDHATLVYYVMNRKNQNRKHRAWLIDRSNSRLLRSFDTIETTDKSWSIFGLRSARQLTFQADGTEVRVQQSNLVDNGPFYQRFLSDGFLRMAGERPAVESARGVTEYIYPARIYSRLFWPLVRMRVRQSGGRPHWVQRSGRLYRWTW
ncbi:hypothetical protein [Fodinibius sediminis]|uniref:Hydroxyneurosporene synthase n=1 Tax=Fodinibius sediminis TaxID=1214077 RepID=A0A521E304_9BACT|nr:hypothetical protein [Fodinibius sediminis]SMO78318.1 hydroxyneurosporene synthase [Fodinibius sediminis]